MRALEDLARKLGEAGKSLKAGDLDRLARELEGVKGQLRDLRGEVEDLKDLQDQIDRLQDVKEGLAGRGEGRPGDPKPGGTEGSREAGIATGSGPASGARPENPNAPTARGADERQRAPFDPRGRKAYGGAVAGPAFTKRSPVEMAGAIEQAAQEAPEALDAQRLSRDDKEAVKEFYQRLGNQKR